MIKGLRGSTIWSEDLNNLLPFYRDTLGLRLETETDGFVVLSGGLALGTHSEVHGKAKDPYRHIVGLDCDDIRAEHKRLKDAGVEFLEEPQHDGGVSFATFKDPEGNLLQLLQFA